MSYTVFLILFVVVLGQYSLMLHALQGDHLQSTQISLKQPWQQAVVEAIIAYNELPPDYAYKKDCAIQSAREIQCYMNIFFQKFRATKNMPFN
ncbi:hypothetical protein [Bacillus ndiopicus]|uniref:hypothetical protein n=1 Tax=Bacillus ndiopicus TaxID=1347368 RepID=UPI0005A7842E|nr:hypothetical protein [Bacillus ndiopicus]